MKIKKPEIDYIITHGGNSHHDDIYAVSIFAYLHPEISIHRKVPTENEINNKKIAVIDVGKKYDPELLNFDHHHFKINKEYPEDNKCALDLVLDYLEFTSIEKELCPWLEPIRINDCRGSRVMAGYYGMGSVKHTLGMLFTPSHEMISKHFSEASLINPKDFIHDVLVEIGKKIIEGTRNNITQLENITKNIAFYSIDKFTIADCRKVDSKNNMLSFWLSNPKVNNKKRPTKIDITVTTREDRSDPNKTWYVFVNKNHKNKLIDLKRFENNDNNINWVKNKFIFRHQENYMLVTKELNPKEYKEFFKIIQI